MRKSTADALALARCRDLATSGTARELRIQAGLSLRDMAKAIGCSAPTLYRYENHRSRVHPSVARAYLSMLDALAMVQS